MRLGWEEENKQLLWVSVGLSETEMVASTLIDAEIFRNDTQVLLISYANLRTGWKPIWNGPVYCFKICCST